MLSGSFAHLSASIRGSKALCADPFSLRPLLLCAHQTARMQRQCRLVQQSIAAARRSAALGQQPVRWISSPAEALSYHPSASGSASTSTPTASSSATASTAPSPSESQTSRAERTLRRFWKDVHLHQDAQSGEWTIMLDKRTLKTPSGKKLALPKHKRLAAAVIAHEWDSQKTLLKPHSLPLVRSLPLPFLRACWSIHTPSEIASNRSEADESVPKSIAGDHCYMPDLASIKSIGRSLGRSHASASHRSPHALPSHRYRPVSPSVLASACTSRTSF